MLAVGDGITRLLLTMRVEDAISTDMTRLSSLLAFSAVPFRYQVISGIGYPVPSQYSMIIFPNLDTTTPPGPANNTGATACIRIVGMLN